MKKKYISYVQLTLAMFFAGSTVVAGKFMINIPIFISQTISLIFALLVIFPLSYIREGKLSDFKIPKKDWLLLFLQALTGIFAFRICVILGLRLTSAIEGGIIMSTTPVIMALFSYVFLKESLTKRTLIGILMSLSGIIILNTNGFQLEAQHSILSMLGNLFVLLAVIGEVLFTIFRKKQSFNTHPLTTTAMVILFAFLLFLPIGVYQSLKYDWTQIRWMDLLPMFYYGAFCSVIGYSCWFSGISKVNASVAAGFTGVMPVSSVLLSLILLGEKMTWYHIIGMSLAMMGVYTIAMFNKMVVEDLNKLTLKNVKTKNISETIKKGTLRFPLKLK